jgi:hypothetical protein
MLGMSPAALTVYVVVFGGVCVGMGALFGYASDSVSRGIAAGLALSMIAPVGAFIMWGYVSVFGWEAAWPWGLATDAVIGLALLAYLFS